MNKSGFDNIRFVLLANILRFTVFITIYVAPSPLSVLFVRVQ